MDLARLAGAITLLWCSPLDADPADAQIGVEIRLEENNAFAVVGLAPGLLEVAQQRPPRSEAWRDIFPVFTGDQITPGQPPVAGSWSVDSVAIRFIPRYPLTRGLSYLVWFDQKRLREVLNYPADSDLAATRLEEVLATPDRLMSPSTYVSAVYPSTTTVPANLLKFYLHFSAPMSRGLAAESIRLVDGNGQEVRGAFLDVGEELWDARQRRLTVFFDPGRIKRGLRPHLEVGPPLREGEDYRLIIDRSWLDSDGLPLVTGHEKEFSVGPADRAAVDPKQWVIGLPEVGSAQPMTLEFGEPLDHALLSRSLRLVDSGQRPVLGVPSIVLGERRWKFTPARPWKKGTFQLEVNATLEDLAGNNLEGVFDLEISAPRPTPDLVDPVVSIPIRIDD